MAVELKVPTVGESITEVQIGDWLVPEGQSANKEDALVVIETDKVTVELPAPVDGTVTRVLKKKGDTAAVGEVIGYIEEGAAKSKSPVKSEGKNDGARAGDSTSKGATATKAPPATKSTKTVTSTETRVMPAAARALHTSGVAAEDVEPTGPGGRMLKEDVQRAAETKPATQAKPAATAKTASTGGAREEEVVPMTPLRKRIAQRLVEAKNTAALLTTFNEIDMSHVMALRSSYKDSFEKKHGVKLGFMSFFVKAAIQALKDFPAVNAEIDGQDIVYKNYYDIGVAVSTPTGLVVPVVREADQKGFALLEKEIAELGLRARDGKLAIEELTGGTFTITNGGIFGSLMSTPILNPPQSGILGMHKIQERPIAVGGQMVIRPMMYVALSYDHRIIDGKEAVSFLVRVKDAIEDPQRLLLDV